MAAKKYYTVDSAKKKVFAQMEKLTKADLKAIKTYLELGYTLSEVLPAEKEKIYTQANILKFFEDNKKDEKIAAAKITYDEKYNEQAGTSRTRKNKTTGIIEPIADEPKFNKDGKPVAKGFIHALKWFKTEFEYDAAAKTFKFIEK